MNHETTINNYNPSTQYYLIKQNINTLNIELNDFDEFIDKVFIKNVQKLDIFRSVMQYAESFFIFFIAKIKNKNSMEDITNIKVESVLKICNYFKLNSFDEYVEDLSLDYENFNDLLEKMFGLEELEKVNEIKKILRNIAYFYEYYKDAYNSIKHGLRLVEKKITHAKISLIENQIALIDDYVEIFCNFKNRFYSLIIPISLLFDNSLNVLEDIHELFNFLMKTNKYKSNNDFEYESTTDFSTDYVRINNENYNYSIILPKFDEFEKLNSENYDYYYANLDFNGRSKLTINVSDEPSYEYPFNILLDEDEMTIEPTGIIKDILIDHSLILNIPQMKILKRINEKIESNIQLTVDLEALNGIETSENINITISDNLKDFDDEIIQGLYILNNILQEEIQLPYNLTKNQKEKIIEFKNSSNKVELANSVLNNLFNSIKPKEEAYLIIWDENRIIKHEFLGHAFSLGNYQLFLEDKEGRKCEIIRNHKVTLSCDMCDFIEKLTQIYEDGHSIEELNSYNLQKKFNVLKFEKNEFEFKENIILFNFFIKK